jgi:hypothetical protein
MKYNIVNGLAGTALAGNLRLKVVAICQGSMIDDAVSDQFSHLPVSLYSS